MSVFISTYIYDVPFLFTTTRTTACVAARGRKGTFILQSRTERSERLYGNNFSLWHGFSNLDLSLFRKQINGQRTCPCPCGCFYFYQVSCFNKALCGCKSSP